MITIWKFPLEPFKDEQLINMPEGAKVLCVQMQGDTPCIWALVDTEARVKTACFHVFATGESIAEALLDEYKYIGTYQLFNRTVWHLFQCIARPYKKDGGVREE